MKRNLEDLSHRRFDVLVVGGGIYGAVAAWDAALRGLSVALIDRADFGSGASQNSSKVIHGGLRYLQDGNLRRMRSMAKERATWMKIAPHLVHPLPCLTPTYTTFSRSQLAMGLALKVNDLVSHDRNQINDEEKYLPGGRIIGRDDCARLLPGLDTSGLTGAAIWHDALIHNSERLLLSILISADRAGLVAANYVDAVDICIRDGVVQGVLARDRFSGQEFEIQSRVVINAAGAWIDQILEKLDWKPIRPRFPLSLAMNLITRQVWAGRSVGLPSQPGGQKRAGEPPRRPHMLFIVPWHSHSIIGTWHQPWTGSPDAFVFSEELVQGLIDEVNRAHPGLLLSMRDVLHVHWGFLPMVPISNPQNRVRLVRDARVTDHQEADGLAGLISITSVKYSTARAAAQRAVDLAVQKLGLNERSCRTDQTPIAGGQIDNFRDFVNRARISFPAGLSPDVGEHLVYTYGSEVGFILAYLGEQPALAERVMPGSPVIKAEILHAVREEMAQTLVDVVQRRTELGAAGFPGFSALKTCAGLMGHELGWNDQQQDDSIAEVCRAYPVRPFNGFPG